MKTLKLFALLSFVITVIITLSNCKSTPPPTPPASSNAPTISLIIPTSTVLEDDQSNVQNLNFKAIANSTSGISLDSVIVYVTNPTGVKTFILSQAVPTANATLYNVSTSWTVPDTAQYGKTYTINIYVVDKSRYTARKNITITVTNLSDINTFSNCQLGAQSNNTYGSFYACDSGKVYKLSQAHIFQDRIDFCYYYTTTNANTIAAPSDPEPATYFNLSNWTIKNATQFQQISLGYPNNISDSVFSAIRSKQILHQWVIINTPLSSVSQLLDNTNNQLRSYIAFKTVSGRWGIIQIVKWVPASDQTTSSIKITVKVDK
jgi:hypothetical protein